MRQFEGYGSKYKYSLFIDGQRVPIIWKEIWNNEQQRYRMKDTLYLKVLKKVANLLTLMKDTGRKSLWNVSEREEMKLKMAIAFGLAVAGAKMKQLLQTPVIEPIEEESSIPLWYWAFIITTLGFFISMVLFLWNVVLLVD